MIQIYALMSAILASSDSSDGNLSVFGLVFFASGFLFYGYVFLRYRNSDKRFQHESRTQHVKTDLQTRDELVRSLTGLHDSKLNGANSRAVHGAKNGFWG